MSSETLPATSNPLSRLLATIAAWPPGQRLRLTWYYRYILFPVGQMIFFIVGTGVLLTALAFFVSLFLTSPRPDRTVTELLSAQLAGTLVSGISIGFVYSMIALGYTLVYGVLKFINFAHSEIFMLGSVLGFSVLNALRTNGTIESVNPVLLVCLALIAGGLGSGILAVVVERVAYRPLRGAPRLVPLITAIGVSFIVQDLVRAVLAITIQDFNLTYPTTRLEWFTQRLPLPFGDPPPTIRITQLMIIISSVAMLLALNYFVNGTKLGRGIRAVSQDQTTAGLMGINVNFMISLTFFLGGAFGGVAGVLFGLNVGTVTPYVGFIPGLKAFTAAVLGGIGNLTGALLGGLMLGMIEAFLNGILVYIPALGQRYTDIFAFSVLILVLIFKPSGLLGERVDEKV